MSQLRKVRMPLPDKHRQLVVRVRDHNAVRGRLICGNLSLPCALGRSGLVSGKREGDGGTPIGRFPLKYGYFRSKTPVRPRSGFNLRPTRPTDGWCDSPGDRNYNRPVTLPYGARAERMWRSDQLYDICLIPAHNHRPRIQGLGSAIFLHLATPDYRPTEGCVALAYRDMLKLLRVIRPGDVLNIGVYF